MRFITTRSVAVSLAALAAAASGALVPGTASAATAPIGGPIGGPIAVPCPLVPPLASPPTDFVRLSGIGVDFGTGGLDGNDARCSGTVRWDVSGNTIRPTVDGELYLKNSIGATFRVRAEFFDVRNVQIGSRNGASHLALTDDETHAVHIDSYTSPLAYRTDVITQVLVNGTWDEVTRQSVHLSSSAKAPDSVTIDGPGQDFGTNGLVGGVPAAPGQLTWDLTGGTTTARLTGNLYMVNSLGQTARLRLRTFDVHGALLSGMAGSSHAPTSNALATYAINLSSLSNPLIYKAEVSIQIQVGAGWQTVGTPVTVLI